MQTALTPEGCYQALSSIVTNIEAQEWRIREGVNSGRQPEHPRASSADDVEECFFSVLRDTIGCNFHNQARFSFRKPVLTKKKTKKND